MANEIRDKRTSESLLFTLDCTRLFEAAETILSVVGTITADQGALVFGTAQANTQTLLMKDGRQIASGKALQVVISGGVIPADRPWLICNVRPVVTTTLDGTTTYNSARELTVLLRLIDNLPS